MPSPFPGMDPYLEGSLWTGMHAGLCMEIVRQLSPRLLPRYVVRTNERLIVTFPEFDDAVAISTTSIYPDAFVAATGSHDQSPADGGASAVSSAPLQMMTVIPQPVRQVSVEIHDVGAQRLITAIEILSPANKRGESRDEYLAERQRILLSTAHLVEIDLLRSGKRAPMQKALPADPYFIILSRAEKRPMSEVWPIKFNQALPILPIPLLPDDNDARLDLQAAFSSVYDLFGYAFTIDYGRSPEPPLAASDAAWANARIRTWREGGNDGNLR